MSCSQNGSNLSQLRKFYNPGRHQENARFRSTKANFVIFAKHHQRYCLQFRVCFILKDIPIFLQNLVCNIVCFHCSNRRQIQWGPKGPCPQNRPKMKQNRYMSLYNKKTMQLLLKEGCHFKKIFVKSVCDVFSGHK